MKTVSKRILFAVGGLIFGLVAGFWGVMISGGGHFILPIMLFISPFGFGLLLWPLWAFLSVRFDSKFSRVLFIATMLGHWVGSVIHIGDEGTQNWQRFWFRMSDPMCISALVLYLAAQLFLWFRFLRTKVGINQAAPAGELL